MNSIATEVLYWKTTEEALEYFLGQDRIELMNKYEIQSIRHLADLLNTDFESLADILVDEFEDRSSKPVKP